MGDSITQLLRCERMRLVRDMVEVEEGVVVVHSRCSGEGERSMNSSNSSEGKNEGGLGNLLDRHSDPQHSAAAVSRVR